MTHAHTAIEKVSGREVIAQTFNGFSQKMDFTLPAQQAGRAKTVMKNFHGAVSAGVSVKDAQDSLRSDLSAELSHHANNTRVEVEIELAETLVNHLPIFLDRDASDDKIAQANRAIQAASNKLSLSLV